MNARLHPRAKRARCLSRHRKGGKISSRRLQLGGGESARWAASRPKCQLVSALIRRMRSIMTHHPDFAGLRQILAAKNRSDRASPDSFWKRGGRRADIIGSAALSAGRRSQGATRIEAFWSNSPRTISIEIGCAPFHRSRKAGQSRHPTEREIPGAGRAVSFHGHRARIGRSAPSPFVFVAGFQCIRRQESDRLGSCPKTSAHAEDRDPPRAIPLV